MENNINKAFAEVYDIIMHLGPELKNKISTKFIEAIKINRDKRI